MPRIIILLAALLIFTGCAAPLVLEQDGALAVIPHETSRFGHIIVEVAVNGQGPFNFALDTGATISVIYEKTLDQLDIEPLSGVHVRVLGVTGTGSFPVADVGSLSVGQETWQNARVALLPDTRLAALQVDGILGVDFMQRYAIWYSQEAHELRLYPKELVAKDSYTGWASLKLYELRVAHCDCRVLAFDIFIDGERIPTLFDLGSTANIMNVRSARKLRIPIRKSSENVNVFGIIGEAPVLSQVRIQRVQVSDMQWNSQVFVIGEFPIFNFLEIDRRPAAIAGTNFFQQRDFIIDFAQERLLVSLK